MNKSKSARPLAFAPHAIAVALSLGWATSANAFEIETGNPDFRLRWDNTIRYNLGTRMESQDQRLLNFNTSDEGDSKFGKGAIVTNRLDLLSEVDLSWRQQFGGRISAAAWYDQAYDDHSVTTTAAPHLSSYYNDTYNSTVKRYMNGPSGELLDAFVWSNFTLGDVPVNVKLGRHALVWGEGLLIGGHAISYSQAPTDGVKAVSSPGIETKEVFLPLNQLSAKAQVTDNISIFGQYMLEWKPTRVPMGGTYLMGADTTPTVDRLVNGFDRIGAKTPGNSGNWGIGARFNVDAIDSTVGVYYRRFNDYAPETGTQIYVPEKKFRFIYADHVTLYGLSIAKSIGPVSVGSDISLRKNGHLNSSASMIGPTADDGARGTTLHWVVNGTYGLPKTPLWDTGVILAEFAYSNLRSVSKNPNLYRGYGYGCAIGVPGVREQDLTPNACSTRDFYQLAVNFTPQYLAVLPSWDLSLPMTINRGLKGKAASGGGGFEDLQSWSIGATMTYSSKYEFSLRYADLSAPTRYNAAGTAAVGGGALNSAVGATDRGWLVFTFKTSF